MVVASWRAEREEQGCCGEPVDLDRAGIMWRIQFPSDASGPTTTMALFRPHDRTSLSSSARPDEREKQYQYIWRPQPRMKKMPAQHSLNRGTSSFVLEFAPCASSDQGRSRRAPTLSAVRASRSGLISAALPPTARRSVLCVGHRRSRSAHALPPRRQMAGRFQVFSTQPPCRRTNAATQQLPRFPCH